MPVSITPVVNITRAIQRWIERGEQYLISQTNHHVETTPLFWYREPRTHVIDLFVWNAALVLLLLILTIDWARRVRGRGYAPLAPLPPRKRTTFDAVVGSALLLTFLTHTCIKLSRDSYVHLAYMLMPCHVYTLVLSFCFLSTCKALVDAVFTVIIVFFSWFPMMALLFPDFSDQTLWYEPHIYFLHHILIWIAPFYMAAQKDRFTVLPNSVFVLCWVLIFGIFLQIDIQTFASYFSGLNVNYQLHPPKLPSSLNFMLGPDYRLKFYVALAVVGLVKRQLIVIVADILVYLGLGTPAEPKADAVKSSKKQKTN